MFNKRILALQTEAVHNNPDKEVLPNQFSRVIQIKAIRVSDVDSVVVQRSTPNSPLTQGNREVNYRPPSPLKKKGCGCVIQ